MMKIRFYSPIFVFLFFNVVLSMPAFSMDEGFSIDEGKYSSYGSTDSSKIYIRSSPQTATPSVFGYKLLPEEKKRLQNAQTPEDKFKLGREFAFEKFGSKLLQDERDQIAVSLFEDSDTPKALGNLGYLYKEDRAGRSLPEDQRYARAQELLERDNSPWALSTIGDMYCYGRYEHSDRRPDYKSAAGYYRKSRTGYSWYMLGSLYADARISPDVCCSCLNTTGGRLAYRCFNKASELGYEVPKEREIMCGGFFGSQGWFLSLFGAVACLPLLHVPFCISYGCANTIPDDRL